MVKRVATFPVFLAALRCACGSDDILSVAAGTAPSVTDGVVDPGTPIVARCFACLVASLPLFSTSSSTCSTGSVATS